MSRLATLGRHVPSVAVSRVWEHWVRAKLSSSEPLWGMRGDAGVGPGQYSDGTRGKTFIDDLTFSFNSKCSVFEQKHGRGGSNRYAR